MVTWHVKNVLSGLSHHLWLQNMAEWSLRVGWKSRNLLLQIKTVLQRLIGPLLREIMFSIDIKDSPFRNIGNVSDERQAELTFNSKQNYYHLKVDIYIWMLMLMLMPMMLMLMPYVDDDIPMPRFQNSRFNHFYRNIKDKLLSWK